IGLRKPGTEKGIDIEYDSEDPTCTGCNTLEDFAHYRLLDVFPTNIAGEEGFGGVFSNMAILLARVTFIVVHDGHLYKISFPSYPDTTMLQVLKSFSFLN